LFTFSTHSTHQNYSWGGTGFYGYGVNVGEFLSRLRGLRSPKANRERSITSMAKHYLLASDFDQTLSFNDSGVVLSELIGFHGFHDKVQGLSNINLVQQGAELSYLILHDPDFRRVRREHLVETGKRIRLKHDVNLFARSLDSISDGYKISFYVISAAPQEIIQSALEGIVPPDHIFGTRFRFNESTGEVESIIRATAGWGKITVLEELRAELGISHDHIIYMGDGSSDLPVMMHVNQYDGLTIAVSEAKFITRVARRTVLSDNAMSVLVPVLEEVLRWDSPMIRRFFAQRGLTLREWDKMRTDMLTIEESTRPTSAVTQ
jgi:HAD superfamily phosphoserine phosphatase-like hydrolase